MKPTFKHGVTCDFTVDIDYEILKYETEWAWLLVIERDDYWFPKSLCEIDKREQIITIPEWLAEEKGLI